MFPKDGKTKDVHTPSICQEVWHNGQFIKWTDARVHVMSHVLHYGSSVFEGIRCYKTKRGPAIFRLREHMQRLEEKRQLLSAQVMEESDTEKRNRLESELRAVESALKFYRDALETERRLLQQGFMH